MKDFLQSLRERKLFQWTAAYLAFAFVVLQVYDLLVSPFPGLIPFHRPATVLLGAGIPIALVLAWYHGEKGEQGFTGPELLIVASLLVAGGIVARWLGPSPLSDPRDGNETRSAGDPTWLLPADLIGNADPELRRIAQELVLTELAASPALKIVQTADIERALELSGRPDTTEITPDLALELAERGGIRPVLAGSLDLVGSTFSVRLSILDRNDGGSQVAASTAEATGRDELIPAVGRAARDLRRQLGEAPGDLASEPALVEVTTPSLEALRLYRQRWGTNVEFIDALQRALAHDTGFAAAMLAIPNYFANLGDYDSAMVYARRALERSHRLTARGQLEGAVGLASMSGDIPEAYRLQRQLIDRYGLGHNLAGVYLDRLGRHEQAVEEFSQANLPFGPGGFLIVNQMHRLMVLRRFDQVEDLLESYPNPMAELTLRLAQHQWPEALALGNELAADPSFHPSTRDQATINVAAASAAMGQFAVADSILRASIERGRLSPGQQRSVEASRLLLSVVLGEPIPSEIGKVPPDSSTAALVFTALVSAWRGDSVGTDWAMAAVLTRDSTAYAPYLPAFNVIEAGRDFRAGRFEPVVARLSPATSGYYPHYPRGNLANTPLVRWVVAESFERLGQPDSAAYHFNSLLSPTYAAIHQLGLVVLPVHRRLALLYEDLGQAQRARQHWREIVQTAGSDRARSHYVVAEARARLQR